MAKTKDKPPITEIGQEPEEQGIVRVRPDEFIDKIIPYERTRLRIPELIQSIIYNIEKRMDGVFGVLCYKEPFSETRDRVLYVLQVKYWRDEDKKGSPAIITSQHLITRYDLERSIGVLPEEYENYIFKVLSRELLSEMALVACSFLSEDPEPEEGKPKQLTDGNKEPDS